MAPSIRLLADISAKFVGLAVLLAASALLYDLASSPTFNLAQVSVVGNRLMATSDLELAAAAGSANMFWLRRSELVQRLERLPPIESARVSLELPDHLLIEVKEREPVVIWLSGETPFLVDAEGLVLAARPAPNLGPNGALGPSGQRISQPLLVIRDRAGQNLAPGSRVDGEAVRAALRLEPLLTQAFGPRVRRYEIWPDSGLNVLQETGPRLIVGNGDDLDWKVAAIQTITHHLESTRTRAELIDARFGDRPYFR
jgi:hypothetical protein